MKSVKSVLKSEIERKTLQCSKHGQYHAVRHQGGDWTNCPGCEHEARLELEASKSSEAKQKAVMDKLREAGVPLRFQSSTFSNFITPIPKQKAVLDAVMGYASDFESGVKLGRCLAFVGNPGTGKTHLAAAIIREVLAAGYSAKFSTVGDYVRQIKDFCWSDKKSGMKESEVIQEYVAKNFLVLDEVGVQFGTKTEENLIFTLINKRYENLKPTLVISNENEQGLEDYLGARVFDRLKDGGGLIIPFEWESVRGMDLSRYATQNVMQSQSQPNHQGMRA